MIRGAVRGAACAAALALGAGCATPTGPVPLPPGDPRPEAWLALYAEQSEGRRALRATARLAVDAEGVAGGEPLRVRSKQSLAIERPARLRVDVQGLLGTTLAVLAVDESGYAFFETQGRHYETGPVHDALLWNVVRLDLTPAEAVGLLLGAPVLEADWDILAAHAAGEGTLRLYLGREPGSPQASLDLDADARLRRYAVWDAVADAAVWSAELSDHAQLGGKWLARRIQLETRTGAQATVSLSRVELNPTLAPDIFQIERPGPGASDAGEGG